MRIALGIVFCWILFSGCITGTRVNHQSLKQAPSVLLGHFTDDYGSSYTITKKLWKHGTKAQYHLLQYNKEGQFFIARNDKDNPSDPGLYTRIDIIYFEGMEPWRWGYCLTAYKATTMMEAQNTTSTDRTNPRKGCNGFPFSRMKPTEVKQKESANY